MVARIGALLIPLALLASGSQARLFAQTPPLEVTEVRPAEVEAGTPVTILGKGLTPTTVIRFGSHDLVDAKYSPLIGVITGKAPPLASTEAPGPKNVFATDGTRSAALPNGVAHRSAAPGSCPRVH